MKLTVIATGSAGNCYVLQARRSALMLECGVRPERVIQAVPTLRWSTLAGVLVSHEHGDHAAYMKNYIGLGVDVYASFGTFQAKAMDFERRARRLHPMMPARIGEWTVKPFAVVHDAAEPLGFIIEHREAGRILFVTDTRFVPLTFKGQEVDHILCEANYDDAILDERVAAGYADMRQAVRVKSTHMSIRSACEFLRANETGNLKNVVLLHLSDQNSNAAKFQRLASDSLIFARVEVARPGLELNLNANDF